MLAAVFISESDSRRVSKEGEKSLIKFDLLTVIPGVRGAFRECRLGHKTTTDMERSRGRGRAPAEIRRTEQLILFRIYGT